MIKPQPRTSIYFGSEIPYFYNKEIILRCPNNTFPPFQIIRPANGVAISDLTIRLINQGGDIIDLKALMTGNGLEIKTFNNGTDYIIWSALENFDSNVSGGVYYCEVSDGITVWYSQTTIRFECGSSAWDGQSTPDLYITDGYINIVDDENINIMT